MALIQFEIGFVKKKTLKSRGHLRFLQKNLDMGQSNILCSFLLGPCKQDNSIFLGYPNE